MWLRTAPPVFRADWQSGLKGWQPHCLKKLLRKLGQILATLYPRVMLAQSWQAVMPAARFTVGVDALKCGQYFRG